jgi:predicted transcriptional regulator
MENKKNQMVIIEDGVIYIITCDDNNNVVSKIPATIAPEQQHKVKSYFKKGAFFLMTKAFAKFMTMQEKYTSLTFRVLFELLNKIEFNNRIETFRQTELAKTLNSSQANISRALKTLLDDNVIYKNNYDYYFTDEFVKFAFDERGKSQQKSNSEENFESKSKKVKAGVGD